MSVELPVAPVDSLIRQNAGDLRVSAEAAESLTMHIQEQGAELSVAAAERADDAGRKTMMAEDFGVLSVPPRDSLDLPLAPVDRIARLDIDGQYRVAMDARVALASVLEAYATDVAAAATTLAHHADRRTVTGDDIEAYYDLAEYFE